MAQTLIVTNISKTVPHSANQIIQSVGRLPPHQSKTIYEENGSARPTAFRIVHSRNMPNRVCVPLTFAGQLTSPAPQGRYYVTGTQVAGNFRLTSYPFELKEDDKKDDNGDETESAAKTTTTITSFETPNGPELPPISNFKEGLFYCDGLNVDCPFKVTGDWTWSLHRFDDNFEVAMSNGIALEIYFFLGPTAFPPPWPGTHVLELIRLTVPDYGVVAGLAWDQVESRVVKLIVSRLWDLGGMDLRYDIESGSPKYLKGNTFLLGAMLRREHNQCNCFDLAAFVYTAFKSLGRRGEGDDVSGYLVTGTRIS
ncbi:MAG: hypothetical protein Q9160_002136 [Pyrenula sp. 1 TL-2023]